MKPSERIGQFLIALKVWRLKRTVARLERQHGRLLETAKSCKDPKIGRLIELVERTLHDCRDMTERAQQP